MDPASNTPIVILKSEEGDHTIPIWIGLLEATSIASAMQNIQFDRPMTHDLFINMTEKMNIAVHRIDICDLKDNTFFAEIHFVEKDNTFTMDARPSDAIAIAIRCDAPIFVADEVIKKSGMVKENGEILDTSEEGKKWADYLEQLSPDEFGKYKI